MKRFHFQLDSALDFRRRRMEAEQARMETLQSRRATLIASSQDLDRQWQAAQALVLHSATIHTTDLQAMQNFHYATDRQKARIAQDLRQLEEQILLQRRQLIDATRQVRLLEKLKQRRHSEWSAQADREIEAEASDLFLAKWPPAKNG